MDNLVNKIQLYCDANGKIANFNSEGGNVLIQDDMIDNVSNPYISKWNVSGLIKPTDSQLNALASEATKLKKNNIIKDKRKFEYGSIGDQLDLLYKDMIAGKGNSTGEWFKAVKKVKDDNPKE